MTRVQLRELKCLVLDEADKLLNMDFEKELDIILRIVDMLVAHATMVHSNAGNAINGMCSNRR